MPENNSPIPPAAGYHGVRNGAGRPTLCTPELVAEFEPLIRAGNFFETVCDFLGIVRETARRWMRVGAKVKKRIDRDPNAELSDEEERCLRFFDAIRRAAAAADLGDLAVVGTVAAGRPRRVTRRTLPDGTQEEIIEEGMPPNWNAASWRLSRRRPRQFGQTAPIRLQHEGSKDGPPVQVEHSGQVTFYLPDNGRGGGPLTQTNEDGDGDEHAG